MLQVVPPETPTAIQERLAYLQTRKAALDELILCLERYAFDQVASPGQSPGSMHFEGLVRHSAGAA